MDNRLSLPQLLGTGLVLILVLGYAVLSFLGMAETQDAKLVDATQMSLQETLERGESLLGLSPTQIHPANLVNATRASLPKGVRLDTDLHLDISASGRQAWFAVDAQGHLALVGLKRFSRYHVANGHIARNNHWSFPVE